jgi:two-component system phosphate regulon response regulator PhoB
MKQNILVVEDDEDILELILFNLKKEGAVVRAADSGEKALTMARTDPPDLILLDIMLPGLDGIEVCRQLKSEKTTRHIPVIMVTAKGEETDIVTGLEMGADDYMTKPFRPKELVARIRAVLRRTPRAAAAEDTRVVRIGDIEIHPGRREVRVKGKPVDLTYTEFEVLRFLSQRPGWVFTRYQLVDGIRGDNYPVTDRAVDVQIVGLRRKLGKAGDCVETVRGVGYRFKDSVL